MVGVLHQPGYPLYTLVASCSRCCPSYAGAAAEPDERTLGGRNAGARRAGVRLMLDGHRGAVWGGLAAVLALGTGDDVLGAGDDGQYRMPTAFFTAWCLYLLMAYRQSRIAISGKWRIVIWCRLRSHFSRLGHYFVLAFMRIVFLLYIVLVDPMLVRQPRRCGGRWLSLHWRNWSGCTSDLRSGCAFAPDTGIAVAGLSVVVRLGPGFAGDITRLCRAGASCIALALLPILFRSR